mgnify:CR=1 FL=1
MQAVLALNQNESKRELRRFEMEKMARETNVKPLNLELNPKTLEKGFYSMQ